MIYAYPFTFPSSNNTNIVSLNVNAAGNADNLISLTGFSNADLIGMIFSLTLLGDRVGNDAATGNPPTTCNYLPFSEVELKFNGQTLYYSTGSGQGGAPQLYKLINSLNRGAFGGVPSFNGGPSFVRNANVANGPVAYDPIAEPAKVYPLTIMLNECSSAFREDFCNSIRVHNNSLELRYRVNPSTKTVAQLNGAQAVLNVTYLYNALVNVQRGVAAIDIS